MRVERARRDRRGQRRPPPPTFTSVLSLASSAEVALSVLLPCLLACVLHLFVSLLHFTVGKDDALHELRESPFRGPEPRGRRASRRARWRRCVRARRRWSRTRHLGASARRPWKQRGQPSTIYFAAKAAAAAQLRVSSLALVASQRAGHGRRMTARPRRSAAPPPHGERA